MDTLVDWRPREGWHRTLVKTLTYRVFMFLITALVALTVTGSLADAVNIGVATNVLKTLTYFGYERAWSRIYWGTTD